MAKVVILTGSLRRGGNTDILAQALKKGAEEAGHSVRVFPVYEYHIHPCVGCDTCFQREDHSCFMQDGMEEIYAAVREAETLVVASPVYFYSISASLKAVIDRFHNPIKKGSNVKQMVLMLVGGASYDDLFDPVIKQYQMLLRFFKLRDAGQVLAPGLRPLGAITGTKYEEQAYEIGKNL